MVGTTYSNMHNLFLVRKRSPGVFTKRSCFVCSSVRGYPRVPFRYTVLTLAQRIGCVCLGYSCSYLYVQGIWYSFLPSRVALDWYMLVKVYLCGCSVWFELLLNNVTIVCSPMTLLLQWNTPVK